MSMKDHNEPKKKSRGRGCLITLLVILALVVSVGGIGWLLLSIEHREAASLPLDAVDFNKLRDGIYTGEYAGGMFGWRANKSRVTVTDGRVSAIELLDSIDPGRDTIEHELLYQSVIAAQSLQVDTVSSATLTSKAYLQTVENALLQAQYE